MNPNQTTNLATDLSHALNLRGLTLDELAAKTKVPRASLRTLFGEDGNVLSPGRVYLRAHLKLVSAELGLDAERATAAFDDAFPEEATHAPRAELPPFSRGAVAAAAGLTGIGVLAIVLSLVAG